MAEKCMLRDFFVSRANLIPPNLIGDALKTPRGQFVFDFLLNADSDNLHQIFLLAQMSYNKTKSIELWFYEATEGHLPSELAENAKYSDFVGRNVRIGESVNSYESSAHAPMTHYITVIFE